jgi:hypothetical protein
MKLNNKTLRQLRRALRTQATELVKFREEIVDSGVKDHWRWKSWVNHASGRASTLAGCRSARRRNQTRRRYRRCC